MEGKTTASAQLNSLSLLKFIVFFIFLNEANARTFNLMATGHGLS